MEGRDDLPWDFFRDWLSDAASALRLAAKHAPPSTPIAWHTQHYPQVGDNAKLQLRWFLAKLRCAMRSAAPAGRSPGAHSTVRQ